MKLCLHVIFNLSLLNPGCIWCDVMWHSLTLTNNNNSSMKMYNMHFHGVIRL